MRGMNQDEATKRRKLLDVYFQYFFKLPSHIINFSHTKRLFAIRTGDLDTNINLKFDAADHLMDLLDDFDGEETLNIMIFSGRDVFTWTEDVCIGYDMLWAKAERKVGYRFRQLQYKDECESMVDLNSDEDLRLILATNKENLRFYVS
jgi:hypothetical protein